MRDNDQNRCEADVQLYQQEEENKAWLLEMSIGGALWTLFAALMYAILAA